MAIFALLQPFGGLAQIMNFLTVRKSAGIFFVFTGISRGLPEKASRKPFSS
jgi:hypothetical protein